MTAHHAAIIEVLRTLKTDRERGLTEAQARERLNEVGPNQLTARRRRSALRRFLDQFKDAMILILIGAATVSFGVAFQSGDLEDIYEPILILVIVAFNALLGMIQERRAEAALEALKKKSSPRTHVTRGGTLREIDAAELVPGDILRLEAGNIVPADARLLTANALKAEESALTGESVPAEKDASAHVTEGAAVGDRVNMVYAGSSVAYGTASAVVTATGMDTEMGRIAHLLDGAESVETPLQRRLGELGKQLGIAALIACAVIFGIGLIERMPPISIFMVAVSLAVAAIPEGLPVIVTIVLSIGVQRMVRRNAVIRRIPAVETLGNASVICSDKTGTLTQNRMTVLEAYADGAAVSEPISDHNSPAVRRLLRYAALCCDASVSGEGEAQERVGDPTEIAILMAARRNQMEKAGLNYRYPRLHELPFDSDRKRMTSVNRIDGRPVAIVKGAFEAIAGRCVRGDLKGARTASEAMGEKALRVLAVGYRTLDQISQDAPPDALERDLTFLGLVGMIDPPRPEAHEAVRVCQEAGIRPVMITGDHLLTAAAIGRELDMLRADGEAVTGAQVDAMTDEALDQRVEDISVYARVSPENKIRIVRAWQRRGAVVAMTGDGVNDAPALKAADIGCAMGIAGTDVAIGAADMTLTDDNFATIVHAVREGRGIYANIRKVVAYLLSTNIGEIVAVFIAMLLWRKTPILSMQLLMVNLVTDSLPAIALGVEAVEGDVMRQRPRPKEEGIFAGGLWAQVAWQGLMFGALTLLAFFQAWRVTGLVAGGQTLAFFVMAMAQISQSYNMRSERSIFAIGPLKNRWLNLASLASAALTSIVMFTPVSRAFKLIALPPPLYALGLGLSLMPLIVLELYKSVKRRLGRQNATNSR